ncbi:MAG: DUF5658 family protein [Candidatus Bathyarchaeia archaeon]
MGGIDFDRAGSGYVFYLYGGRSLPHLLEGRYPLTGENYSALVSLNTKEKLGLDVGSKFSILGEEFNVVGITSWGEWGGEERIFTTYIPYQTLVKQEGRWDEPGDALRYNVTQQLHEQETLKSALIVIADSYDHALELIREIPLQIDGVHHFGSVDSLEISRRAIFSYRIANVINAMCFVALGFLGLPRLFEMRGWNADSLVTRLLMLLGLGGLYAFSLHIQWPTHAAWPSVAHLLSFAGGGFIPLISVILSLTCLHSMWRLRLFTALLEGVGASLGWTLTIFSSRVGWYDPWSYLLLAYPVFPALIGVVRSYRIDFLRVKAGVMPRLVTSAIALQLLDILSTFCLIARGFAEVNPLGRYLFVRFGYAGLVAPKAIFIIIPLVGLYVLYERYYHTVEQQRSAMKIIKALLWFICTYSLITVLYNMAGLLF